MKTAVVEAGAAGAAATTGSVQQGQTEQTALICPRRRPRRTSPRAKAHPCTRGSAPSRTLKSESRPGSTNAAVKAAP